MGRRYLSWRISDSRQHVDDEKPTGDARTELSAERSQDSEGDSLGAASSRADSDHSLIAECCAGNKQAFDGLVRRHNNSIATLAGRLLGDQSEAQDVTQDTFLRAYERIEEFRGDAQFSTWLYRICHNLCLSRLKRKKTDPITDAGEEPLPEELAAPRSRLPDQVLIRKERQNLIKQALAQMTQEFREVLVLHHTHLSYDEIAELLGLPVGTVRSRLHRGREEIKAHLRPYLQDEG